MKIAVVGAGIAGLTCAHLLNPRHDLTVFEAEPLPGGHTRTLDVETETGAYRVDTGFIVFNDRNYPGFELPAGPARRGRPSPPTWASR